MIRVLGVISLVVLLYLLLPIVVVVGCALGRTGYLAFPPHGLTLHWFATALQDPRYMSAFVTSLIVASCSTVLALLLGLPAAYALARHEFPFRHLAETALMLPLVLPALVLSIALTLSFSRIGFTAGTPRLILAHLLLCTPYVVRVALPVLQRLDVALEEAAQTLGASPAATFLLVTLPAIRPGAIAAAVLAFIVSFDESISRSSSLIRARPRCQSSSIPPCSLASIRRSVPFPPCSCCWQLPAWRSISLGSCAVVSHEFRG